MRLLPVRRPRRPGFTLLELLTAVTIAGIVSGLAVVSYQGVREYRAQTAMRNDLTHYAASQRLQKLDGGRYAADPTAVAQFQFSEGVSLVQASGSQRAWKMIVQHDASQKRCELAYDPVVQGTGATTRIVCYPANAPEGLGNGTAPVPGVITATVSACQADLSTSGWTNLGPNPTYRWQFGDGESGAGQTVSHCFRATGTYPVTLTVVKATGERASIQRAVTVTLPAAGNPGVTQPTASFTAPAFFTYQGTVDATASAAPMGRSLVSYRYDFGNGDFALSTTPVVQYTYPAYGSYTVRLIATDNVGAADTTTRVVTADLPPTAGLGWTVTAPEAGQNPLVPLPGQTVQFSSSASADPDDALTAWAWTWSDNGSTSAAQHPARSFALPGAHTVTLTVTDAAGQPSAPATQTLTVNDVPVAALAFAPVAPLPGQAVTFTSTATDAIGGLTARQWTFGGDASVGVSTASPVTVSWATGGAKPVRLAVTDAYGVTRTKDTTITVNTKPVAAFSWAPTYPLPGQVTTLTDASTDADGSVVAWAWDFGDGTTSTLRNPTTSWAAAGAKTVTLRVQDNQGAWSDVRTQVVQVNAAPVASFTLSKAACVGLGETVTLTSTSTDAYGSALASYTWTFGTGANQTPTNAATQTVSWSTPGTKTVTLQVTDGWGAASNTASNPATVNAPPTATLSSHTPSLPIPNDPISVGGTLTDPEGALASYSWSFPGGTPATSTAASPTVRYATGGTKTVTVTVTDACGATATSAPYSVFVAEPPVPSFTITPAIPNAGQAVTLTSTSTDPDGSIVSSAWSASWGNTGAGPTWVPTAPAAGSYSVTLTVTDNHGLVRSTTQPLTVNAYPTATFTLSQTSCVVTGTPITVTSTATDPDGAIASNSWTFGGGGPSVASATGSTASVSWSTAGPKTVQLTATDTRGAATTSPAQNVGVVGPAGFSVTPTGTVYTAGVPQSVPWAVATTGAGRAIASATWSFGGTGASTASASGASAPVTYSATGTKTATVTVSDTCGASASPAASVTVNAAPTITVNPTTVSVTVGTPVTITASGADADGDPVTITMDGPSGPGVQSSYTFTPGAAGTYQVAAWAHDGYVGSADTATATITVTPVILTPPTISLACNSPVEVNIATSCSATITDNGNPVTAATIDFGDATTSTGSTSGGTWAKAYGAASTYTVTACTSYTGGPVCATDTVVVTNAPLYALQFSSGVQSLTTQHTTASCGASDLTLTCAVGDGGTDPGGLYYYQDCSYEGAPYASCWGYREGWLEVGGARWDAVESRPPLEFTSQNRDSYSHTPSWSILVPAVAGQTQNAYFSGQWRRGKSSTPYDPPLITNWNATGYYVVVQTN